MTKGGMLETWAMLSCVVIDVNLSSVVIDVSVCGTDVLDGLEMSV